MVNKLNVAIIDYDMGNVKSIENAISHVGDFNIIVTSNHDSILNADIIVLPGVGAFPDAMKKLSDKGLIPVLNKAVKELNKPTLGICLGMQLLFESSEEKELTEGLGWIPGKVIYMKPKGNLRVPHVGWNSLDLQENNNIFDYLNADKDFYFVHSLHVVCEEQYLLAKFDYGGKMTAAVYNDNIVGMQFHPEKSQKNGLLALSSFFDWANLMVGKKHA
jgi:imidazole glycerol-phosphate synthase subunit HisH